MNKQKPNTPSLLSLVATVCLALAQVSPAYGQPEGFDPIATADTFTILVTGIVIGFAVGLSYIYHFRRTRPYYVRSYNYLAAIERISQGFSLFLDPDSDTKPKEAFSWILRETAKTADVSICAVWLFSNDMSKLTRTYSFDSHHIQENREIQITKEQAPAFFDELHKQGTLAVHSVQYSTIVKDLTALFPENQRPISMYFATIGIGENKKGLLQLATQFRSRHWQKADHQFCVSIADLIAYYISTQGLRQTQKALRQEEERFRDMIAASSDWYWETGPDHKFSFLSNQFTSSTGIPEFFLMGKARNDFNNPQNLTLKWREHLKDLEEHKMFRDFQYTIRYPQKEVLVSIHGKPFFDAAGNFMGYRGTGSDITESRKFQNRFEEGINALTNGFALWDEQDRLVHWNNTFLDFFPTMRIHADKKPSYTEFLRICNKNNIIDFQGVLTKDLLHSYVETHLECRRQEIRLSDGRHLMIQEQGTSDGGIIGIYIDITPMKERERALITSNQIAEALSKSGNILIHARNETYILAEICRIITAFKQFDMAWISLFASLQRLPEKLWVDMAKGNYTLPEYYEPRAIHKKVYRSQSYDLIIDDFGAEVFGREGKNYQGNELKAGAVFPIMIDTFVAGFLSVSSKNAATFDERHLSLLSELSNDIGFGLASIRNEQSRMITEDALRESEGRYRGLIDMSPDGVLVLDKEDKILFANKAINNMFNLQRSNELLGRHFSAFMEDDRRLRANESEDMIRSLDSMNLKRLDNSIFQADITFRPVRYAGQNTLLVVLRDVTERNQINAQLTQASKMATLGEMAAGITHELSQPLNIMRFAAEGTMLKMGRKSLEKEEIEKQFELISKQCARMADIIDHMRVFSRKDTSKQVLFDPRKVIMESVQMISSQYGKRGIEVTTAFPSTYEKVNGRPIQLEQVILNLMTNAHDAIVQKIESAPAEPATMHRIRIDMSFDEENHQINIIVADTGGGIPEDMFDKLFEPFSTTKEVGKGTGLGLSVSYGIISALGGNIKATNKDEGACFDISLPSVKGELCQYQPSPQEILTAVENAESEDFDIEIDPDAKHILVVDDEVQAAEAMMEFLFDLGYMVNMAGNGKEALDIFNEEHIDLLITDIRMPEMSGAELIQKVRRINGELPIIVLTGHAGLEADESKLLDKNVRQILKKPVSLKELTLEVENALKSL